MLDAEREGHCLGRKEAESESDGKGKKCETGGPATLHKPMTESSACWQSQEVQRRSKDLEADLALSVDRAMELEKLVTDLKDELASGKRNDSTILLSVCICMPTSGFGYVSCCLQWVRVLVWVCTSLLTRAKLSEKREKIAHTKRSSELADAVERAKTEQADAAAANRELSEELEAITRDNGLLKQSMCQMEESFTNNLTLALEQQRGDLGEQSQFYSKMVGELNRKLREAEAVRCSSVKYVCYVCARMSWCMGARVYAYRSCDG